MSMTVKKDYDLSGFPGKYSINQQLPATLSERLYVLNNIISILQPICEVVIISDMRNFVLRDKDGNAHGVFTGKQSRQAALKAANRSSCTKDEPMTIMLRERRTKKVQVFKAWSETVKTPKNRPAWMPEDIRKSFVKKEKIETIE